MNRPTGLEKREATGWLCVTAWVQLARTFGSRPAARDWLRVYTPLRRHLFYVAVLTYETRSVCMKGTSRKGRMHRTLRHRAQLSQNRDIANVRYYANVCNFT